MAALSFDDLVPQGPSAPPQAPQGGALSFDDLSRPQATGPVDVSRLPELDPERSHGGGFVSGIVNAVRRMADTTGGVMRGEVDPTSPQAIGSMADAAMQFGPTAPVRVATQAAKTWLPGQDARASANRPPVAPVLSPRDDALGQAARLSVELPTFMASDSRALQSLGQASRQLPLAGSIIEKAADTLTTELGGAAKRIGSALTENTGLDRAALGNRLRSVLEGATENLSEVNHRAYESVRAMIEPNKPVRQALEPLQNVMADVMARRAEGGETKLGDLEPVANLLQRKNGLSFAGLQRARSRLGKAIDFDARQGGMEQGDLKQVHGALTEAMGQAVRGSAKVPDPEFAAMAWKAADQSFAENVTNMKSLSLALRSPADEAIVGQLLGMAGEKTGNAKRLVQLQQDIGPETMKMLGAHLIDRAGGDVESWSAAKFATSMDNLSSTAKSVLFGPQRRQVEDLHALASRWKEQEAKFANRSNTGRAALTGGALGVLGTLTSDPISAIGKALAGAGAGLTIGKVLSRPATAKAAVQTARAYERAATEGSPAALNAFHAMQRILLRRSVAEFGRQREEANGD